jgi:predicted AAA+ superfamily ATPase
MEVYRTYMLVGGMPQAVKAFVEKNSFSEVEDVKASILNLYQKDATKLDGKNGYKASSLLRSLASGLERHDKMFSPGALRKDSSVRDYKMAIYDLGESMMVNICYRITDPAVDQSSHFDEYDLKIYMGDTGLLFTQSFRTLKHNVDGIYSSILSGDLNINQGMYFENMVAQSFRASGHGLFFSKFTHHDTDRLQEVDFIITRGRSPTAVEVKSGQKTRQHKSLDRFIEKYGDSLGTSFVIHSKDLDVTPGIVYLPIYMTSLL